AILDVIEQPLQPKREDCLKVRRALLEKVVEKSPDNLEFLVQLALVYEEQGELERCEKLLTPHTGRLKATEGARILGHILADQGKTEEAYPLLRRYVDENLKHLREAEKVCKETFRASGDAITKEVQTGSARDFPRQEFERASDVDKQAIYLRYLGQRL